MLIPLLCFTVQAGDPAGSAPPPDGWGHDCSNWIYYADPWSSGPLCYEPGSPTGSWILCDGSGSNPIWPDLDIELWVEMECTFTWDHTHAMIHRHADYGIFHLNFHGTSSCNHGQYVITTPPNDPGTLNILPFVTDVLGRGPGFGTDIPLYWEYRIDGNPVWLEIPETGGKKWFVVSACDHDFDIRVRVDIGYHQEDGYYYLGGEGASICPAEPL